MKGSGVLKKIVSVSVFASLMFVSVACFSCFGPPKPIPEEEAVMNALKKIQQAADTKASYTALDKLLVGAGQKIESLKTVEKKNACFYSAATKSYASYEIVKKAWKLQEETADEKRKIDLAIAASVTMGFASVSLAKAEKCFE
jgi:hypothetical protein